MIAERNISGMSIFLLIELVLILECPASRNLLVNGFSSVAKIFTFSKSKACPQIKSNQVPQKLNNTYDACEKISSTAMPEDHIMISYDVKSLFTSVPHDLALQCVSTVLNDTELYFHRTNLLRKA